MVRLTAPLTDQEVPGSIARDDELTDALASLGNAATQDLPWVNVEIFGAVGDGTTDDTAAIQAAFNAGAGGLVVAPRGLTFLCNPLTTPAASMTIDFGGSTLKAAAAGTLLTINGNGVDIRNTRFDGADLLASTAVYASGVFDLKLDIDVVSCTDRAVDIVDVMGGDIKVASDDCHVGVRCYGACVDVDVHDGRHTQCDLYGVEVRASASAGTTRTKVRRCTVKNFPENLNQNRQGIVVYGEYSTQNGDVSASPYHVDVEVVDNEVVGPGVNFGSNGTADHYSFQRVRGLQVLDNRSVGGGENAYSITRYVYGAVVGGNTSRDMFGHAVQVGVAGFPTEDVVSYGNIAMNVNLSLEGSQFAAFFFQHTLRPVIVGNVATNPGYYGFSLSNVTDATYVANHAHGALTAKELIQGVNTWNVRDQFGVRESSGYLQIGTGPFSASGDVRLRNTGSVKSRNAANTADFFVFRSNGLDQVEVGDAATPVRIPKEIRHGAATGPLDMAGTGSPEGVIAAPIGSSYRRIDGGAGSTLYVKESGTGNTGWVPK